jgi:protocatechuate 3,4-dioxygenase beta subunit
MSEHDHEHEDPRLDRGLQYDVSTLMSRRRALGLFAGAAGAALLAACGAKGSSTAAVDASNASTTSTTTSVSSSSSSSSSSSKVIPTETAGPYPGDGSNGPDVLKESGIVRSDIRSSFGSSTTTAPGVPLTVKLKVLNNSAGNVAYAGTAVYLWHCNQAGQYSMYGSGIEDENYLRGVQEADADGYVTFKTIFPAAYSGRWPHIHFEVYSDLATATSSGPIKKTTQLALPEDVCKVVYATSGYEASVRNLASTSLARDMVFSDDQAATQLASVTGSVADGYVATLNVPV